MHLLPICVSTTGCTPSTGPQIFRLLLLTRAGPESCGLEESVRTTELLCCCIEENWG
uniref:Uncharacterized protein n=1 Tax=Octopus bimaculoides TaxID=37653 RepID=A0A0L8IA16_OCTBM